MTKLISSFICLFVFLACDNTKNVVENTEKKQLPVQPQKQESMTAKESQGKEIFYREIQVSKQGGRKSKENLLIKDKSEFQTIWNEVNQGKIPKENVPEIDFEKKNVVAIFFGELRSGGFEPKVQKLEIENNQLNITLETPKANWKKPVTTAISNPYLLLEIDKPKTLEKINLVF